MDEGAKSELFFIGPEEIKKIQEQCQEARSLFEEVLSLGKEVSDDPSEVFLECMAQAALLEKKHGRRARTYATFHLLCGGTINWKAGNISEFDFEGEDSAVGFLNKKKAELLNLQMGTTREAMKSELRRLRDMKNTIIGLLDDDRKEEFLEKLKDHLNTLRGKFGDEAESYLSYYILEDDKAEELEGRVTKFDFAGQDSIGKHLEEYLQFLAKNNAAKNEEE